MQQFSATPKQMLICLWRNRSLIRALAKREVLGRYRGSVLICTERHPQFLAFEG